jgi:hypothetical protein
MVAHWPSPFLKANPTSFSLAIKLAKDLATRKPIQFFQTNDLQAIYSGHCVSSK